MFLHRTSLTHEVSKFNGNRIKTSEHYCERTRLSLTLAEVAIGISDLVQNRFKNHTFKHFKLPNTEYFRNLEELSC